MKLKPRHKHSPAQQSAALKWINNHKPPKVDVSDLRTVEFKPLVLDRANLEALERAADPYRRLPGDGR